MSKYNYILTNELTPELIDAFDRAHKDSPFANIELDREASIESIKQFDYHAHQGRRMLIVAEYEGRIVGLVAALTHPFFKDTGQEMIWWVEEGHRDSKVGFELISFVENWAKSLNLKHLFAAHYHNDLRDRVAKMYEKNGYTPVEYNYMKEIK